MKRKTKIWLSVAGILMAVGLALFVTALCFCNWDLSALNSDRLSTEVFEFTEGFDSIRIEADTEDILILPSADDVCRVVCRQWEKQPCTAAVRDNTLTVQIAERRQWYEHIGIYFGEARITIHLPEKEYNRLSIRSSTGDIQMDSLTVGAIDIQVSTADVQLNSVLCRSLSSKGSTGDMTLNNVLAEETIQIDRSTGDVELRRCDAQTLSICTDTGDVEGTLLTDKVFLVETDTGDIDIPQTTTGGVCRITTDTGDVEIKIL